MKLSAPIHILKSKAKSLKKSELITMTEALDKIANKEGFGSWSLLQSKSSDVLPRSYDEILDFFNGGDLVLIGARPSYGKTSFTIGLFVKAIQLKRSKSYYFTLSETHKDVAGRIGIYDGYIGRNDELFELNYSNDICADYIISHTKGDIGNNSVIVIDYLQLLDEKRINEPLQVQIEKLKKYAKEKNCIIIFISQVNREIEYQNDRRPTKDDIRLPNPLDISLLNKIIFLFREQDDSKEVEVSFSGKLEHLFKIGWDRGETKFF
ncbi:MAG: DNA helicase [Halobacteriovoraceae bacterium]|jgi:replicative DNA helicase|nr:DNA helicase [Halobacteriovoraceae bacterium]